MIFPLYFETNYQHPWIEKVVTVAASQENCLKRIRARDGLTLEVAKKRIQSQIPIEEKIRKSDFVICNDDDSFNGLQQKVDQFLSELTAS